MGSVSRTRPPTPSLYPPSPGKTSPFTLWSSSKTACTGAGTIIDFRLLQPSSSSSGEYLLAGSANGSVRIHPLSAPFSLSSLEDYWAINMHDNLYGAVTHITASFDDRYVLTGGADGNVFVYTTDLPTAAQREAMAMDVKVRVRTAPVVQSPLPPSATPLYCSLCLLPTSAAIRGCPAWR